MVDDEWIELAEKHDQLKEDFFQLKQSFFTLMGRLWLESPGTMSPEVREIMGRYAMEFEAWMHNKGLEINPMRWMSEITEWKTWGQAEIEEVFRRR